MARRKKDTVDYFPHPVNNGTRMFIMEQTYGDKGYVAYYKLLEMIGRADGHFIDLKQKKDLLFYSSQIKADQETTCKILQTLAEIGAIDLPLWNNSMVVWCEDFIEKIAPVYENRKRELPKKPSGETGKNTEERITTVEITSELNNYGRNEPADPQTKVINIQSKVKESKVKESTQSARELSIIETFFRDLPNSPDLEVIAIHQGLSKDYVLGMIAQFKAKGCEPSYPNFQRFTAHFGNWIRKNRKEIATSSPSAKNQL